MDRIDRQQREAALVDGGLVEHLAVELGGDGERAADQRRPPDQRQLAAAAAVAAPGADDVVVEIDLPVGILGGGDVGEVGGCDHLAGLAVRLARERDMAEELGRDALDRLGAGSDDRHVGAAAPGPLREVADRVEVGAGPGFLSVRRAGLRERGAEPFLPAPVGA